MVTHTAMSQQLFASRIHRISCHIQMSMKRRTPQQMTIITRASQNKSWVKRAGGTFRISSFYLMGPMTVPSNKRHEEKPHSCRLYAAFWMLQRDVGIKKGGFHNLIPTGRATTAYWHMITLFIHDNLLEKAFPVLSDCMHHMHKGKIHTVKESLLSSKQNG